jgi:hypothetical protein
VPPRRNNHESQPGIKREEDKTKKRLWSDRRLARPGATNVTGSEPKCTYPNTIASKIVP